MNEGQRAGKPFVELACKILSDENVLALARQVTMDPGGNAALHLELYLQGTGLPLKVNLDRVLATDEGVREEIQRQIIISTQGGRASGTIPIPQYIYANHDWQFAIGSMNIEWKWIPNTNKYTLKFRNLYRWHPSEQRVSQCVHQAAENLKLKGAKEYWMYGETTIAITDSKASGRTWGIIKARI